MPDEGPFGGIRHGGEGAPAPCAFAVGVRAAARERALSGCREILWERCHARSGAHSCARDEADPSPWPIVAAPRTPLVTPGAPGRGAPTWASPPKLPTPIVKYPQKRPPWEPERWEVDRFGDLASENGGANPVHDEGGVRDDETAAHMARFDPARVIRQAEALRDLRPVAAILVCAPNRHRQGRCRARRTR